MCCLYRCYCESSTHIQFSSFFISSSVDLLLVLLIYKCEPVHCHCNQIINLITFSHLFQKLYWLYSCNSYHEVALTIKTNTIKTNGKESKNLETNNNNHYYLFVYIVYYSKDSDYNCGSCGTFLSTPHMLITERHNSCKLRILELIRSILFWVLVT